MLKSWSHPSTRQGHLKAFVVWLGHHGFGDFTCDVRLVPNPIPGLPGGERLRCFDLSMPIA
jgi:hypothetical protein